MQDSMLDLGESTCTEQTDFPSFRGSAGVEHSHFDTETQKRRNADRHQEVLGGPPSLSHQI